MNHKFLSLIIFISLFSFSAKSQTMQNKLDTFSYSLGVLIAQNLKQQGIDEINPAAMAQAVADVVGGKATAVTLDQANQIYQDYSQSLRSKQFEKTIKEGEAFLKANASRPEVKVTESGLQYEVITEGAGEQPKPTDKVRVHYHGTLINGEVFDSSVERGEPISFPVNGVIQGWQEALPMMKVGSKWKLFIPYQLAYGERGAGPKIGPYSALVFEVELLGIN